MISIGKERVRRDGHKLGGYPYLISVNTRPAVKKLLARGYFHFLQLDFIVQEDADWDGSWYFGDGLFNLFCRPRPNANWEWRWLWQM